MNKEPGTARFPVLDSRFAKNMDSKQDNQGKLAAAIALGSQMGFMIAISLVGFLLAGIWLDQKFGTMPLFTVIFVVASMFSVAAEMRYIILPILEKRSQNKKDK